MGRRLLKEIEAFLHVVSLQNELGEELEEGSADVDVQDGESFGVRISEVHIPQENDIAGRELARHEAEGPSKGEVDEVNAKRFLQMRLELGV